MKKLLISLITSLMLISSFGFNTFAEDIDTQEPKEILRDADPVEVPEEYATKVANIVINFAWAFSGGGKFLFGACLGGGIVGIIDVATDLLGEIFYFGPSTEEMQREELMDKLNSIDASIGDVSSKVDSLADQINESIKQIDTKLDNISIKLDKDNISNVANVATYLRNEMNNYDSVLTSQIHTWYENRYIDNYLTAGNFILKVPNGSMVTIEGNNVNDLDVIYIDDDLMSNTITAYVREQLDTKHNDGWDADKKDTITKEIFKRIFSSENFDKSNGSDFDKWIKKIYTGYTNWDSFANKDEAINKLADAGYATLCEIAARNIAKTSNGANTYAKDLVEKFTAYCNYLTEANGEYTSPLASYANIYSSIYAFQGDLKRTIEYDTYDENGNKTGTKQEKTNLLKLCEEKYIGELNELGTFVGLMAKASGNYGETTDMRKLIYIPWAAAEKKLQDDYKKYYHVVERRGDLIEVDNYCYITKSVIDVFEGTLNCDLVMKFYAWENLFGTDIKSYRDTYMAEDFSFNMDNNRMVGTTDLSLIWAHYASTNGDKKFIDYLKGNSLDMEEFSDLPTTYVTKFIGGRDFTSDDRVTMFIKNCHNNPDKWSGKDYLRGDTTTVTSSSSHFKVRRKATADVFDLETGVSTLGKRIAAVASFYEKYTFKDDLVVFWDAEYNNPQTKDDLLALADKDQDNLTYWRERYDTSSDDEERYRSHVEYCRNYGVFLSYSLDDPSAPVNGNKLYQHIYTTNNNSFGSTVATNIFSQEDNDFIKALKKKGLTLKDYEDFVYDDTYRVYFDETKYTEFIDEATYTKLLDFCLNDKNMNKMVNDYYSYNELIKKMINNLGELVVSEDADQIAKQLIKNDLDAIILDYVPKKNIGSNVYDYKTGKLYIWNNHKYEEYTTSNTKIKSEVSREDKVLPEALKDSEHFASKFNDEVMKQGDYPIASSKDIKLEYQIKTILAFELFFDKKGNVQYRVHPIYDVTPILTWKDGKESKQKEVSDKVTEVSNIKSIEIMLPIINLDNSNDNHALVKHYSDLDSMYTPIEVLSSSIEKVNKYNYSKLRVTSFSPYVVSSTYYKDTTPKSNDTKKEDTSFRSPQTGIE